MNPNDWGCWISLALYTHFIISWYTRKNFATYLGERMIPKFCQNNKTLLNFFRSDYYGYDLECRQLISGCLLDLVFIVNFRLMIINFNYKWLLIGVYDIYYKNCKFEVGEAFKFSSLGVHSLFSINLVVTIGLLGYMIKTKQHLFEYIVTKNYILNIYILFLLHGLVDGCLQLFYKILQEKI